MSDLKLFRVSSDTVEELKSTSVALEKSLQTLIEQHLELFLGIRFLASEHSTGKVHGGRIDTLGIDENGCPVIIEYKRALNENVINQGLFYLDWLMDHKADFRWLVMDRLGKAQAENIEWDSPRLLCIAGDFTNYDEHAVKQIPRNIDLIRYRRYGDTFLLLELAHTITAQTTQPHTQPPQPTNDLFELLKAFLLALGDDVHIKENKNYIAFKRMRNFASVAIRKDHLLVWCIADPLNFPAERGFSRIVNWSCVGSVDTR